MITGSVQEEDIKIGFGLFFLLFLFCFFFFALNVGASQYIRQIPTAIKEETDSNTIIEEDFITPLTPIYRLSRQKKPVRKHKF